MSLARWLGVSFAAAITAAAFAACKTETGTGGAGGSGGASRTGGATSSVSSSSSSSSGATPDAGPLVCKGVYSTVPKGSCDLWKQDCAPGQTCQPSKTSNGDYTTACIPGGGLKSAGEDCYSPDDCAEQLFCIGGKCSPVCCRDNDAPCAGAICDLSVSFGTHEVFFCHYAPKCDLLTANACAPGLDCHIEDKDQGLATCAAPSDKHAPDQGACSFINDCGDMEQCYSATTNDQGYCHYYCWVNGPASAAPGLGGCPPHQVCLGTYIGKSVDFGVPGLGLCFSDGTTPPDDGGTGDAGPDDAGSNDAGSHDGGSGDAGSGDAGNPADGGGSSGGDAGGPKDAATD